MKNLRNFDFRNLFVLDLANNHQGSVSHGKRVIQEHAKVIERHNIRAAIKFQFRDLPEFIHIDERENSSNKHVPRFLSTQLTWSNFAELLDTVRCHNLFSICTPFDEASVDKIVELGFDLIKVASCSAGDWPLLEKVASSGLPIIASTGGMNQVEVDNLVSFFVHRGCDFALMHCVSIYPTPDETCNLANIANFKNRYPNRVIGWSTHEPPQDTIQIGLAAALGAQMFERHIGVETDEIKLNAYSSTPEQLEAWLSAYFRSLAIIGSEKRTDPNPIERKSIDDLRRGVFAKVDIEVGTIIREDQVYFAFPYRDGQLSSGEWKLGIINNIFISADGPLLTKDLSVPNEPHGQVIKTAIHEVKAMLAYAKVPLTHEFTTEYSHHYGVANFRQVGAVLINIINRAYAKKVLVQLPGQMHPLHFHKLKEETFLILWGELISELDGRERVLKPGDTLTVPPGVWHCFRTETGCVFEEISTTAYPNDSVYRDPAINALTSKQRKTYVDHWGRFQLKEQLYESSIKAG
jgi:sialic acid synthase SpsE/quercetin dioxygenase-like cupin family protein